MKKIIKIFTLMIFILLVFGITTSQAALEVKKDTTVKTMIDWLDKTAEGSDGYLTGISNSVRKGNPYLYCRQRGQHISSNAKYVFNQEISYPSDDSTNGYAKAYILAAPGYGSNTSNGLRQYAWWYILGQESGTNELLKIAKEYQDYKENENTFNVVDEEKTIIEGNTLIYGPIKVTYSYASASSGSYSDEWGGFNYAFLIDDEVVTSGVKLCTLSEDGSYKKITSDGTSDNYYKIRTTDYIDEKLYVIVDLTILSNVNKINLKIKQNTFNYTATVYNIVGNYTATSTYRVFCSVCESKITTDTTPSFSYNEIIKYNGSYYKYSGVASEDFLTSDKPTNYYYELNFAGTTVKREDNTKNFSYDTRYYCSFDDQYFTSRTAWEEHFEDHYSWDEGSSQYRCGCHNAFDSLSSLKVHRSIHLSIKYYYIAPVYSFYRFTGCSYSDCGTIVETGSVYESQKLSVIKSTKDNFSKEIKADIDIPILTSIEITKTWEDYDNTYNIRPETLKFNVFRSTDQETWEKLTENTDYKLTIESKEGNTWEISITDLVRRDDNENDYYFKVEEQELVCYQASYPDGKLPSYNEDTASWYIDIDNSLKKVDLTGYVWLDGQTGIKSAVSNDGIMQDNETKMQGISVYLNYKDPTTGNINSIASTVTDSNGYYKFEDYEIGYYYVWFEYDGINYEDTKEGGDSKAFETDGDRNTFNGRFKTITYGKSNDGTTLSYSYANNKSTLVTAGENGKVKQEFVMNASTQLELYTANIENLNLGLIKRGTDIALSTDVSNAEVNINGQKTNYTYNSAANTIEIGNGQTSENVSYNLNLYTSDYYYRIRNYVSNDTFKQNDYINGEDPSGVTTGEELKVYVTYELNLQNQSTKTVTVNSVDYLYDTKYEFKGFVGEEYQVQSTNNVLSIDLHNVKLAEGETKTLYLLFEVNNNEGLTLGNFSNYAEITSYSNDEGLIDVDSQPGNFMNNDDDNNDGKIDVEDDNDTAGGLTIKLAEDTVRKITGKVFDCDNNQNINDVIVQLIELKTVNGNVYEYIWQETVSGTGKGIRLNNAGTALEEYTYTKEDGTYEFIGFIPGDYIVRFIYGDGTTYDMTGNVIKYNGQDYKSTEDANYNSEWYNSTSYTEGTSVARDNEARRLETMAYSVNIDAEKGLLLKLLDNTQLNLTEKETLISIYNKYNDTYGTSDISINDASDEVIEGVKKALLLKEVLPNTWMCAETSKIKVAVDTENITNTSTTTTVNGINTTYVEEISNINLGLELRPETKIELKKYITGFKLTAANGQTLVNAYIDVDDYLENPTDISNKVLGIKDNVTILDTVWQYEVAPTDINTIVDGASLEFEYTLVVKNTGDNDYLSADLAKAYKDNSTADYVSLLTSKANEMKGYMRDGKYNNYKDINGEIITGQIGNYLENSYYAGGTGTGKVLTEVTNIRDYINNDLTFVTSGGDVAVDEDAPHKYRILRDDYTMQEATINTVLKTTKATGKMENDGTAVIYKVTLGKNPISATGNLNFENYIAEVMSFTNAAGRRAMTSTPGNAEIIDHEHRKGKTHEIDEADTARIQIGAATGEDGKTNYIIIIAVTAGIALIATGVVVLKKYVIK